MQPGAVLACSNLQCEGARRGRGDGGPGALTAGELAAVTGSPHTPHLKAALARLTAAIKVPSRAAGPRSGRQGPGQGGRASVRAAGPRSGRQGPGQGGRTPVRAAGPRSGRQGPGQGTVQGEVVCPTKAY